MSNRIRGLLIRAFMAVIIPLLTCLLLYFVDYAYVKQVLEITVIFMLILTLSLIIISRLQRYMGKDKHEI